MGRIPEGVNGINLTIYIYIYIHMYIPMYIYIYMYMHMINIDAIWNIASMQYMEY